jgi:hypothetical protein
VTDLNRPTSSLAENLTAWLQEQQRKGERRRVAATYTEQDAAACTVVPVEPIPDVVSTPVPIQTLNKM